MIVSFSFSFSLCQFELNTSAAGLVSRLMNLVLKEKKSLVNADKKFLNNTLSLIHGKGPTNNNNNSNINSSNNTTRAMATTTTAAITPPEQHQSNSNNNNNNNNNIHINNTRATSAQ